MWQRRSKTLDRNSNTLNPKFNHERAAYITDVDQVNNRRHPKCLLSPSIFICLHFTWMIIWTMGIKMYFPVNLFQVSICSEEKTHVTLKVNPSPHINHTNVHTPHLVTLFPSLTPSFLLIHSYHHICYFSTLLPSRVSHPFFPFFLRRLTYWNLIFTNITNS